MSVSGSHSDFLFWSVESEYDIVCIYSEPYLLLGLIIIFKTFTGRDRLAKGAQTATKIEKSFS